MRLIPTLFYWNNSLACRLLTIIRHSFLWFISHLSVKHAYLILYRSTYKVIAAPFFTSNFQKKEDKKLHTFQLLHLTSHFITVHSSFLKSKFNLSCSNLTTQFQLTAPSSNSIDEKTGFIYDTSESIHKLLCLLYNLNTDICITLWILSLYKY